MLSAEGNENGEKNNNSAALFFCTFLCRCFARLQRETSINFLVTRFMAEICRRCSCLLFFTVDRSHPQWPPASRRHKISCCSYNKKCLLFFLSRSSSFSRWASLSCRATQAFSCSLSFSFSIFQICGHDNWSKLNSLNKTDTETFSAFRFRFDS